MLGDLSPELEAEYSGVKTEFLRLRLLPEYPTPQMVSEIQADVQRFKVRLAELERRVREFRAWTPQQEVTDE